MTWFKKFWDTHGDRLTFATLAISLATVLYKINMQEAAKTIYVGTAMLFFNKARGNGKER